MPQSQAQASAILFCSARAGRFELNQTALEVRARGRDFFSGQQVLQRISEILMAGPPLFGSVSVLIVTRPAVCHGPGTALDAHGFGSSLRTQLPRDGLGVIQRDRQIDFEISRLLAN